MSVSATRPPSLQENPFTPPGPEPIVFEKFSGLNTQASRPGIGDDQCAWLDGFMPLGVNNARTMPDVGASIYTSAHTINWMGFANIHSNPYAIVVNSDGKVDAVRTDTSAVTTLIAAGIINAARGNTAISQWGEQYILIINTTGYWIWDGVAVYSALSGSASLAPIVTITHRGNGYTTATVAFGGGSGGGATGTVNLDGVGKVASITITNAGSGWLAGDMATATISGDGTGATATVTIMPVGLTGNAIETFTGRVWIGSGASVSFSVPGSISDFATSDGGGSFTSNDSFLRSFFSNLKQTNGFLYIIGDSSINYISNVVTSGSGPVTTSFTQQNADPEIGTPWADTVEVFSRNIVLANPWGVFLSYGGAVTKISEALDGVYASLPAFSPQPSSAKAIVFGKRILVVLVPITDPIRNATYNKLFCFDGQKWWSTEQGIQFTFITAQEIKSQITAWGTDGTKLYPLFQTGSTSFTKTIQSKLWYRPGGLHLQKYATRLWALATFNTISSPTLAFLIDNEAGVGATTYSFTVAATGNGVMQPTAVGQQGALIGLTIQTLEKDVQLISCGLEVEAWGYRG